MLKLYAQYKVGNDAMVHQSCIFHSIFSMDMAIWQSFSVKAWKYCQINDLELVGAIVEDDNRRIAYNSEQINNQRALQAIVLVP